MSEEEMASEVDPWYYAYLKREIQVGGPMRDRQPGQASRSAARPGTVLHSVSQPPAVRRTQSNLRCALGPYLSVGTEPVCASRAHPRRSQARTSVI